MENLDWNGLPTFSAHLTELLPLNIYTTFLMHLCMVYRDLVYIYFEYSCRRQLSQLAVKYEICVL